MSEQKGIERARNAARAAEDVLKKANLTLEQIEEISRERANVERFPIPPPVHSPMYTTSDEELVALRKKMGMVKPDAVQPKNPFHPGEKEVEVPLRERIRVLSVEDIQFLNLALSGEKGAAKVGHDLPVNLQAFRRYFTTEELQEHLRDLLVLEIKRRLKNRTK